MTESTSRKLIRKKRWICLGLTGLIAFSGACSSPMSPAEADLADTVTVDTTAAVEGKETAVTSDVEGTGAAETTYEAELQGQSEESLESSKDEDAEISMGPRQPAGHRIIYADGEVYGWTRYEYDEQGRRDMIVFITPTGNEYWSPVFYDGNGHVIPETVGNWSRMDENGLHLEVGSEDSRGRRTPMAEYAYDEKGNLTDYWYMFVDGRYLRHVVYRYDSRDCVIREETYLARYDRLESYIEYIYNGAGKLIRKNEVEDARQGGNGVYTIYEYDEEGRLSREETIWGGRTHDYVEYFYNDMGELVREYHFLENPMMGGPYTVEYLFEAIDDSAG